LRDSNETKANNQAFHLLNWSFNFLLSSEKIT
jgi:hypothetical protein